jgi:ABC-2 type transport system permease protein
MSAAVMMGIGEKCRGYGAVLRARFAMLMQYRAAALAGLGTQVFWGMIFIMVYEAFYASSAGVKPIGMEALIAYIWLNQAFLGMLPWNVDKEVLAMVRTGSVANELLKPLDLYGLWFARALAWRTAPTLLRSVPMLVLAWMFLGLTLPPSLGSGVMFVVTMAGALILCCAMTMLLNISLLWTLSNQGLTRVAAAVITLFSGSLVPLVMLPDWAQVWLMSMPFAAMRDQPFRVYSGHIPAEQAWGVVCLQVGWTVLLVLFGKWLLGKGMKRLVVQGG